MALTLRFQQSSAFQQTLAKINAGESVVWDGAVGSSSVLLGASVLEATKRPLLALVTHVGQVERVASDFSFFTDAPVYAYPALNPQAFENNKEVYLAEDADFGARLRVLKALDKACAPDSNDESKRFIVVASLLAVMQPVPSESQVSAETVSLKVGDYYDRDELIHWLAEGGLQATSAVEFPGEYSARGDILDVYAIDWKIPYRIEFFGDTIESIRSFNVVDQRKMEAVDSLEISRIETHGKADARFVDRLPKDSVVLMNDTSLLIAETKRMLAVRDGQNKAEEPAVEDVVNALYTRPTVHSVTVASGTEYGNLVIRDAFSSVERLQGNLSQIERAFNETLVDETVALACPSEADVRRLRETFQTTKLGRENRIEYKVGSLLAGFEWREGKVCFISSDQLFGRAVTRRVRSSERSARNKTVDSFLELNPGELVVHVDHGLARFRGIETQKDGDLYLDKLKLEFYGGKYVYVPIANIGKIQRYVGPKSRGIKLSHYGGSKWKKQRMDAFVSILQNAQQLIDLQAKRQATVGTEFPEDGPWQKGFEALFPFSETEDQKTVIEAIKKDMESPRPMDRLLCGDVGFGKTEVALRAAFKAVEAGYQVAFLSPTTVLAEQHYRTFCDRASSFPINIATLSRFSTKKEQKATIEKLETGEVDVVIGTHRILQKDVRFNKLGLVVIDEEQKFGVEDKERLKRFRETVDVLTLTATPIPRTLHYALLGIRDISNLTTPPAERLPVETRVLQYDPEVVSRAVLRELNRGGQVFFLHNRVSDIESVAAGLRELIPSARIRVGHAQMDALELESIMRDFVLKKFDMLVCTTIIESGIDIPNANTMFVDQADKFGLAELHQLRGRVGREKKQAYCYLMLEPHKVLTPDAVKRLQALKEYDKLGAGYQIAMKDLEIRGAGNILGVEQSGHLEAIGYELYCELLEAAVCTLKKEPQKVLIDVDVNMPCSAILPKEYISEDRSRMDFYRRFNRVKSFEDISDLRDELMDRFGPLPQEAENLVFYAQIKLASHKCRVKRVKLIEFQDLHGFVPKLELCFVAQDRMFLMQSLLERRHISMRFLEGARGGFSAFINLPRDLFDANGKARASELLKYVFDVLNTYEDEDVINRYRTQAERPQKSESEETAKQPEKNKNVKRGADSPLGAKMRELKKSRNKQG